MAFGNRLINAGAAAGLQVGDAFGGGIIFWLDGSGGGMVTATSPQPADSNLGRWTIFTDVPGAAGTAIGTGYQNNLDIRAAGTCNAVNYVFDATIGAYSDWFLPSQGEISEVHNTVRQLMTYPTDNLYWTSTEVSASQAQALRPWNGGFQGYAKGSALYCLPIRRFLSFDEPFIGQLREGGIVFYINPASGFGYVVSLDIFRKRWGTTQPVYYYQMNNDNDSIGASESNTAAGLAFFGASNNTHIFYDSDNYTYDGYSDWVIPSFNLAKEWWNNRSIVDAAISTNGGSPRTTGGFLTSGGRSETRVNAVAWSTGNKYSIDFTALNFETRFVRKFTY